MGVTSPGARRTYLGGKSNNWRVDDRFRGTGACRRSGRWGEGPWANLDRGRRVGVHALLKDVKEIKEVKDADEAGRKCAASGARP